MESHNSENQFCQAEEELEMRGWFPFQSIHMSEEPLFPCKGLVSTATKICPTGMQLTVFQFVEYLHKSFKTIGHNYEPSRFAYEQYYNKKKKIERTTVTINNTHLVWGSPIIQRASDTQTLTERGGQPD